MYPEDLKYTAEHEWVRQPGRARGLGADRHHRLRPGRARRHRLRLAARGRRRRSRPAAPAASSSRPSRSATSTRRSPARSSPATSALDATPELVNSDPYGGGWLFEVVPTDAAPARRAAGRRDVPGVPRRLSSSRRLRSFASVPLRPADRFGATINLSPTLRVRGRVVDRRPEDARCRSAPAWGTQNPDDARFCSQCGTRLVSAGAADRRPASRRARPTATIPFGARRRQGRDLRPAAQPGRRGRGRRAARRARAARRPARPGRGQPVPARHRRGQRRPAPRQRDLPRRRDRLAPARGVPPRPATAFTVSDVGSLNGTYVNRDRIDKVAAHRRRRGPDRQVPPGLLRRARRAP